MKSFDNFTKKGYLTKQGGLIKNWKKRWFVLKDNYLYYFKGIEDDIPAGSINLMGCKISNELTFKKTGKKNSFEIQTFKSDLSTPERIYFLYADSEYEMEQWMKAIQQHSEIKDKNNDNNKLENELGHYIQPIFPNKLSNKEKLLLNVKGIMCQHCEEAIKSTLLKIKGIKSLEINNEEELVTIMGEIVNMDEILNKLEDLGFLPIVL